MAVDPLRTLLHGERVQLAARLDTHRQGIRASLDGLTEIEARYRLVPSATTLLGILAHVTYSEQVWSVEAVLGTPRHELGLPPSAENPFDVPGTTTVATALGAHAAAVERSDEILAQHGLDDVVTGHRLGRLTVRWIVLHLISEMAQHHGHAEILREQTLALRRS